jgi:hypothetical protein
MRFLVIVTAAMGAYVAVAAGPGRRGFSALCSKCTK